MVGNAIGLSIGIWLLAATIHMAGRRWPILRVEHLVQDAYMFIVGVWALAFTTWASTGH